MEKDEAKGPATPTTAIMTRKIIGHVVVDDDDDNVVGLGRCFMLVFRWWNQLPSKQQQQRNFRSNNGVDRSAQRNDMLFLHRNRESFLS